MPAFLLIASAGTNLVAQVVTVVVAFFLVMFTLQKFAWGPIVHLIDERRKRIEEEFNTLDAKQERLDAQIKDYEERLRQIHEEARLLLNQEVERGKKSAAEIVEDARRQAEELRAKAVTDIQLEVEKARVQLRDEMVDLTIGATERLLKAELNDERHRQLVGNFIAEVETRQP